MTPARFRWGTILITVGVLLLLRNADVLNDNFWINLLIYSPVVLIAIGIEKIFTRTKVQFISYATSVLLFGSAMFIAFGSGMGGSDSSFFRRTSYSLEPEGNVELIEADLSLGETNLTVRESGKDLVYGRFDSNTRKPKISHRFAGSTAKVEFEGLDNSFFGGVVTIDSDADSDWYVRFSEEIPLRLRCSGDRSDIHLNLSSTPLQDLELEADDAHVYLKLGDLQPLVNISIDGQDTNLKLRIPEEVGLRVIGRDYGSYLDRLGMQETDGEWISEGFDSMPVKVNLDIDEALSSFSVDFF